MFDRLKSLLDEILKSEAATTTSLGPNDQNVGRGAAVQVVAPPAAATARNEPLHFDLISGGVMFSVDDVVPASHPLWQGSLAESSEIRAEAKILLMPDGEAPALAPEGYVGLGLLGKRRDHFSQSSSICPQRDLARLLSS